MKKKRQWRQGLAIILSTMLIGCSIPKDIFAETQEEKPVPTLYNEGESSLEEPIEGPPLNIPKDESTLPAPKKPTEPKPPSAGISQFSLFMDEDQPILNEPITGPAPGDGEEIVSEPAIGSEEIDEGLSINQQAIELPPRAAVPTLTSYTYPGTKRGWLDIEWSPVTRASSYIVLIFNGRNYSEFPVSTTNGNVGKQRFTTYEKGIWPTPGSIASGGYQLYADGRGGDLQSDPRPVYTNGYNAGPQYGDYRQDFRYYVRIIAKNSTGRGEASDASTALIKDDTIVKPGKVSKPYVITKNQTGKETGEVELYWDAVPGATGYKVCMFNGKNYSEIPIGNFTFWTSKGKGIWPTKTEIEAGRYQLHTDGKGTELPIDPRPVYTNGYQAGGDFGDYRTWTNLFIYVKAVNSAGDGPGSEGVTSSIPLETPTIIDTEKVGMSSDKGFIGIEWNEVPGAEGYKIWLFNGYNYQSFDVEDRTYWSTLGEGIFPTEDEINQGIYQFHLDGKGEELPVRPWNLYRNGFNAGGLYGDYRTYGNYWITVSAYTGGKNSSDAPGVTPTIPFGEDISNDFNPLTKEDAQAILDNQDPNVIDAGDEGETFIVEDPGGSSTSLTKQMLDLTSESYKKPADISKTVNGWTLYKKTDIKKTSFFAVTYRKETSKNKYMYAVAFRGTQQVLDTVADGIEIVLNLGKIQSGNAEELIRDIVKKEKKNITNMYYTGHSLGGYLAAWVGSGMLDRQLGYYIPSYTLTFNAPGLAPINLNKSEFAAKATAKRKMDDESTLYDTYIENRIMTLDGIGNSGYHLGNSKRYKSKYSFGYDVTQYHKLERFKEIITK